MNIIGSVILVILGVSVVYGFYRGFMHTVLSLACCLISVFLAFNFGPKLTAWVSGSQGVSSTLATYTDAVSRVGDYDLASSPVNQLSDGVISQILENVDLPQQISTILENNLRNNVFSSVGLFTVNDYVSNTIVAVAIHAICYLVCFAVSYLLLSVIVSLIHHVSGARRHDFVCHFPVDPHSQHNHSAGGI